MFIGRHRARSEQEGVRPGDEVYVAPRVDAGVPARLLAAEDGLVAADKPAGLVTIPDQGGASSSLIASVARAIGAPVASLHATSRLDRGVSGVVIFARTEAAAARLRAARERGLYSRRYVAIAATAPAEARGDGRPRSGAPAIRAIARHSDAMPQRRSRATPSSAGRVRGHCSHSSRSPGGHTSCGCTRPTPARPCWATASTVGPRVRPCRRAVSCRSTASASTQRGSSCRARTGACSWSEPRCRTICAAGGEPPVGTRTRGTRRRMVR